MEPPMSYVQLVNQALTQVDGIAPPVMWPPPPYKWRAISVKFSFKTPSAYMNEREEPRLEDPEKWRRVRERGREANLEDERIDATAEA